MSSHSFTHRGSGLQPPFLHNRTNNLQLLQFPFKHSNIARFRETLCDSEFQSPFPHTESLLQPKGNAPKSMDQSRPDQCSTYHHLLLQSPGAAHCHCPKLLGAHPAAPGHNFTSHLESPGKLLTLVDNPSFACRCCSVSEEEVAGGALLSVQMFLGKTCGADRTTLILEISSTLPGLHKDIHISIFFCSDPPLPLLQSWSLPRSSQLRKSKVGSKASSLFRFKMNLRSSVYLSVFSGCSGTRFQVLPPKSPFCEKQSSYITHRTSGLKTEETPNMQKPAKLV